MQSLLAKARVTVCDEEEDQSHFEEEEEVFYLFRPDNTSAGSNDPASYHQFATIMFVCGHRKSNDDSKRMVKTTTSKSRVSG